MIRYRFLYVFLLLFLVMGCGKPDTENKKDAIALVNKEPIYESDLDKEIALRVSRDPNFKYTPQAKAEQLEIVINKRIIIQEAMEKGLARSEKFVETIKSFWEQALIRDLFDLKKSEFKDKITVSAEEIKKYYDNLSSRVTFRVLKSTDRSYIDDVYDKFIKNKEALPIPFETVGPVGYDEIGSNVLLSAFEQPIGEAKIYPQPPDYYLIIVDKRDARALEPIEDIKDDIEKRIVAGKEAQMFEEWLAQKRKQSKITIVTR